MRLIDADFVKHTYSQDFFSMVVMDVSVGFMDI